MHNYLSAEAARNAALINQLKGALQSTSSTLDTLKTEPVEGANGAEPEPQQPALAFLRQQGSLAEGGKDRPLTTTTQFTLSQLPALQSLLAELRPMLKSLGAGSPLRADEEKSARTQRIEYIESQTRRHLENVRGLELGPQGEIRDGEWQGEGRTFGEGEVSGLEKVVGMLGGGAGGVVEDQGDAMDES